MCSPKCLRSLSFKDLGVFNEPKLRRNAWHLIPAGESLSGRVFSAKYYSKSTFLDSFLGPVGSFSWKSIWGAKALVKGVLWCVGNGRQINIWRDSRVLNGDSRFIPGERVSGLEDVCDLIDFAQWSAMWTLSRLLQ